MSKLTDREIEQALPDEVSAMPEWGCLPSEDDLRTMDKQAARNHRAIADAGYKRGEEDGIKKEQKRIIKMLNQATDTRDLDRRLKEFKNEQVE